MRARRARAPWPSCPPRPRPPAAPARRAQVFFFLPPAAARSAPPPLRPQVGYVATPSGLRARSTVWAEHLNDECTRRFYKNWHRSKENKTKARKAFTKYVKEMYGKEAGAKKGGAGASAKIADELKKIAETCSVVRVIAHTQISKINLRQKKVRGGERGGAGRGRAAGRKSARPAAAVLPPPPPPPPSHHTPASPRLASLPPSCRRT